MAAEYAEKDKASTDKSQEVKPTAKGPLVQVDAHATTEIRSDANQSRMIKFFLLMSPSNQIVQGT